MTTILSGLETLCTRCDEIFITGLSMGGTLTLYMAATHADMFRGAAPISWTTRITLPRWITTRI